MAVYFSNPLKIIDYNRLPFKIGQRKSQGILERCRVLNNARSNSFTGTGWLWLFAGLFLILGLGYSTLTPIFENSDETLHYPYIKHLADGQGLPLATPGQPWNQEGTQPPLYYAIVAASTFWINTDNLPEHLQTNPHWLFTEVRSLINDNQNLVLHGPADAFPYHNAALAIHIGRWWSLFFGLITVICTFLIARHLFPQQPALAVTATALTALTPQFLRVSATVSNDSLSAALAAFTVLLALKFTQPNDYSSAANYGIGGRGVNFKVRHVLILGLLAGLALLTKLSSLSVFFLVAFIIFWRLFFLGELQERPWLSLLGWLALAAAVVLLLNSWFLWRNYQLYGEWLATETHLNLAGRGYLSPGQIWDLRHEIERAYWATFGWGQIRPPEWVFVLLGWFSRIGLLGLVAGVLVKLVQGDRSRPIPLNTRHINLEHIILLAFWAALNLALYVRWITEVGSVSHTRLIFPAITALSLLLALGWHSLMPPRAGLWFAAALTVALVALNIYSLDWLIGPAFTPNSSTPANLQPVNVTFANSLMLSEGAVQPTATTHDNIVTVAAQWQVIAPADKNYSVSVLLLTSKGEVLARRETYPGLGLRPTRSLAPGQTFTDLYPLTLTAAPAEPLVARAVVSLFDFDSDTRAGFPALDAAGNEVTPVVGQLKLVPSPWPQYQPQQETSVTFGNAIQLTGYDLTPANQLTLYWRSLAPVDADLTLFVHLLDEAGNIIAQADAPPTNGVYPTRWWSPGELIADRRELPAAPGVVSLRLGLYNAFNGQRLPVSESSLPVQDNGVIIPLN